MTVLKFDEFGSYRESLMHSFCLSDRMQTMTMFKQFINHTATLSVMQFELMKHKSVRQGIPWVSKTPKSQFLISLSSSFFSLKYSLNDS